MGGCERSASASSISNTIVAHVSMDRRIVRESEVRPSVTAIIARAVSSSPEFATSSAYVTTQNEGLFKNTRREEEWWWKEGERDAKGIMKGGPVNGYRAREEERGKAKDDRWGIV